MLKMHTLYPKLRQLVVETLATAALLYTSDHREGWRHNVLHLIICFTVSLTFGGLLLLSLFSLKNNTVVLAGGMGLCLVPTTLALFFSKRARCFGVLFLISCGMRQGRNLLITAGTGLVIFWNVQNTFRNLKELAGSMICNLEKRRIFVDLTPIRNYVNMLKWIAEQLERFTDVGVVKFTTLWKVTCSVDSKDLEDTLRQAGKALNATADHVLAVMDVVSVVSQSVAPIFSVVLLSLFTALYVRQYQYDRKFKNTFITGQFVEYDRKQQAEGKAYILPLTKKEAKRYTVIPSPWFTANEAKAMLKFSLPVLTNSLVWILFMAIDALFYWLILTIQTHLGDLEPISIPLRMNFTEIKTINGINAVESTGSMDFSYSMPLFEKDCLPKPSLVIHNSAVPLTFIFVVLLLLALLSGKLQQVQLMVSGKFYNHAADVRVQYLHSEIVRRRLRAERKVQETVLMTPMRKASFWVPILFHD